jgi:hypothetical protein
MIKLPQYTVMGEDGHEYGPVDAAQIHEWIAEGRLETKTPVKAPDAKDWAFLGTLPEFAKALKAAAPKPPGARESRKWLVVLAVMVLAVIAILVLKKLHQP